MTIDAGAVLTGVGLAVGALVWLVRLEGRINLSDERFVRLQADIHEIKEDVKALLQKPFKPRGTDV